MSAGAYQEVPGHRAKNVPYWLDNAERAQLTSSQCDRRSPTTEFLPESPEPTRARDPRGGSCRRTDWRRTLSWFDDYMRKRPWRPPWIAIGAFCSVVQLGIEVGKLWQAM